MGLEAEKASPRVPRLGCNNRILRHDMEQFKNRQKDSERIIQLDPACSLYTYTRNLAFPSVRIRHPSLWQSVSLSLLSLLTPVLVLAPDHTIRTTWT